CRTAMQCGTADLLGRRAQQILVTAGKRDRHAAMDVRIDATGYDDLTAGVDDPRGAGGLQTARSANSSNLAPGDADFRRLRASRRDCGAPGNDQIEHLRPPLAGTIIRVVFALTAPDAQLGACCGASAVQFRMQVESRLIGPALQQCQLVWV